MTKGYYGKTQQNIKKYNVKNGFQKGREYDVPRNIEVSRNIYKPYITVQNSPTATILLLNIFANKKSTL